MKGAAGSVDADAAGGTRAHNLSGHSSLSEAAHRILRQTGGTSVLHIAMARQQEQEAAAARSKQDPSFVRSVSGAQLSSAADFEAYRQRVLENYKKHHPSSYGKERVYRSN
jgi:hypothetical protein